MGDWNIATWSAVVVACAALAAGAPMMPEYADPLVEEVVVVVVEEDAETTTLPATDAPAAPTADPKLTLDIPQIPNEFTKNTLISASVLLDLGALDTDSEEDIDLDGTTAKPVPHLIVTALPGSVAVEKASSDATAEKTDDPAGQEEGKTEEVRTDMTPTA